MGLARPSAILLRHVLPVAHLLRTLESRGGGVRIFAAVFYTETVKRVLSRSPEPPAEMFCCIVCFSRAAEHLTKPFSEPKKKIFSQARLMSQSIKLLWAQYREV